MHGGSKEELEFREVYRHQDPRQLTRSPPSTPGEERVLAPAGGFHRNKGLHTWAPCHRQPVLSAGTQQHGVSLAPEILVGVRATGVRTRGTQERAPGECAELGARQTRGGVSEDVAFGFRLLQPREVDIQPAEVTHSQGREHPSTQPAGPASHTRTQSPRPWVQEAP